MTECSGEKPVWEGGLTVDVSAPESPACVCVSAAEAELMFRVG